MDSAVYLAVIFAAFLHAGWNAVVKGASDKSLGMAAVVAGHVPCAIVALTLLPWPGVASLPYAIASVALHCGYQLFLLEAYKVGDMSQVYPIARGTAPLIVTVVMAVAFGERLAPVQFAAVALIGAGILSLMLVRGGDGLRNPRAAALALGTSAFIAGYTMVDGLGARASGAAVGFYCASTIFNSMVFTVLMEWLRPGIAVRILTEARGVALAGGSASFIAYAIAVWGFAHAPIALVAALREVSVIFALLIGAYVMRERLGLGKIAATAVTLAGTVVLRLAH